MKERQRCEQALIHVVHECYMNGVSTRKISSTNTLERLNEEIRRLTKVVGIFPSESSYIRLVTSYLLEYAEYHLTGTSYIKTETLKQQKEVLLGLAA